MPKAKKPNEIGTRLIRSNADGAIYRYGSSLWEEVKKKAILLLLENPAISGMSFSGFSHGGLVNPSWI
jgi:hypothetical protein